MRRITLLLPVILSVAVGCSRVQTVSSFTIDVNEAEPFRIITISPQGSYVALGDYSGVRLYEVASQRELWRTDYDVNALGFSADETRLAGGGGYISMTGQSVTTARIWNARSGEVLDGFPNCSGGTLSSVSFSPDNTVLICGSGSGDAAGILGFWDLESDEMMFYAYTERGDGPIYNMDWSPDGTTIVTPALWTEVALVDTQAGEVEIGFDLYSAIRSEQMINVTRAVFDPSGTRIAVGYAQRFTESGIVGIWNIENHELVEFLEGEWGAVWSIAWSHNGRFIAAGTTQGRVLLWDTATYELIADLEAGTEGIISLAFTNDDARLILASRHGSILTYLITP